MPKLYETAFERMVNMFKASGQRFMLSSRPYYSSGGFLFEVVDEILGDAGLVRLVLLARSGQQIRFFGYGLGDQTVGFGLAPGNAADDADTNMAERTNTNNEDFVIEGLSATSRGTRIVYPALPDFSFVDPIVQAAIQNGENVIEDPSAMLMPPEVQSPVMLEDLLFRSLGPKVSFRTEWNRKGGDYLGTLDEFPEGGGKSYLRANGEPSTFNYWRIPEGYIWRREGAPRDTIFTLNATLDEDCIVFATLPITFLIGLDTGSPTEIWLEWKVRAHGKALYLPSQN